MKKIFLASSFYEVTDLFTDFEQMLEGKRVTFIPTASHVEEIVFYVDKGKEALLKMGLVVDILDISTATYNDIHTTISKNDFIYITGGNTFYLLQELKRTGADRLIIEAVLNGTIYIGESAGAIVMSPNIAYVKEMDASNRAQELKDYSGLGLVSFYTVPHYSNPPFIDSAQKVVDKYAESLLLMPITNKQALIVDDTIQVYNKKVTSNEVTL